MFLPRRRRAIGRTTLARALVCASAASLAVAGCGAADSSDSSAGRMPVSAAFYPLELLSERVGGDLVQVDDLAPPGGEPHDLELTPRAVADLAGSKVVVYLAGFQPAVDDAVASQAPGAGFDVTSAAAPLLAESGPDGSAAPTANSVAEGADPHFWLDPTRYARVATAVGERFAAADPEHAAAYRENAADLVGELNTLDADFRSGLAACRSTDLVTSHTAFAYLAERYGLTQVGISGVSPDAEPSAKTMRAIVGLVRERGVRTVYSETLASPALAEAIAAETGAKMAVLDPVEAVTQSSKGSDYLEVMRSNLQTLRDGQGCS